MKSYFTIILISFITLFVSCNNRKKTTAKIFERKETKDNKLMIKYSFVANGKPVTDSLIIDNKVLNSDSVTVNYNTTDPSENTLELPQ